MSHRQAEEPYVKRMADMLRQGLTLTGLACPVCATPLFKLKNGDFWCARCEKKVIVIKEGDDAAKITGVLALEQLETVLLGKIQSVQTKMQQTEDAEELQKLSKTLSELLENLGKTRETKKS